MTSEDAILDGTRMPSVGDRRRGHSAFKGSPDLDAKQLALSDIDADIHDDATVALLKAVIDGPTAANCYAVYLHMGAAGDEVDSYLWHSALRGHPDAVAAWASDMTTARDRDRIGHMNGLAVALGMLSSFDIFPAGGHELDADDLVELRDHGMGVLRRASDTLVEWDLASDEIDNPQPDPETSVRRKLEDAVEAMKADGDFLRALEDRAESAGAAIVSAPAPSPEGPTLMVIGPQDTSENRFRKEVLRTVAPIIGKQLPLVGGEKLQEARAALVAELPHCEEIIDRVLNRQVGAAYFNARVIFYGDKGCGKSTLVAGIGKAFGTPVRYVNVAKETDASFFGTPSQYGTAAVSGVTRHVADTGIANPVIQLDEIEKAGVGHHNGNFLAGLLGYTEPSTAAVMDDPALLCPVNLSAVSWLCTANSLDGLAEPLRDRFMIVRVPNPTWQHIGGLSKKLLHDIAEQRGDLRWALSLDPDEIEIIKRFWPGGSIRALRDVLVAFMANREQSKGMH